MNLRTLLLSAAAIALDAVEAVSIDHDKVQPFAQPEPATDSETTAIRFKPSLRIDSGCHPYSVSARPVQCTGELFGTAICGFPKDRPVSMFRTGKRHDWMNVVVWLNNPSLERPTMVGVSPSSYESTYSKYTPPPPDGLNGTTVMINYLADPLNKGFHAVDTTSQTGGEFQDLIMWEQLTDEARHALNETEFGDSVSVPFIDANFLANIDKAWPY